MHFSPTKLLHGLLYAAPVLLLTLVACGGGTPAPLAAAYTLGGAVSGVRATNFVLQNNAESKVVAPGDTSYVFSTPVVAGTSYNVTVLTQPSSFVNCVVTGAASGIMPSYNVTNADVSCP